MIPVTINSAVNLPDALTRFDLPDFSTLCAEIVRAASPGAKTDSDLLVPVAEWSKLYREDANAVTMSPIFCADIDSVTDTQAATLLDSLSGVSCIVHTTHSHLTEAKHGLNCLRAVIELDRPYPASEYKRLWAGANARLCGLLDPKTEEVITRGYYLPSYDPARAADFQCEHQEGAPWSVDALLGMGDVPTRAAVVDVLTAWARQGKDAERKATAKAALALLEGRNDIPIGQGQRNGFLASLSGFLAHAFARANAAGIAAHFAPGWPAFNADAKYPPEAFAAMIERFQAPERVTLAEQEGRHVFDPGAPMRTARTFVAEAFAHAEGPTLYATGGDLLQWTGTHWTELPQPELESALFDYLDAADTTNEKGEQVHFNPTRFKVGEVVAATRAVAYLSAGEIPRWLRDGEPKATEIVACQNGLLHLPSRRLLPHTPAFLGRNVLPYAYDPQAPAPARWGRFLAEVFKDDDGARDALQEVMGYLLTQDTRQQKLFLFVGPKRSGKGTVGRVLRELLGAENVTGPTLNSLQGPFGLQPLIGKQAAIIADARLGGRAEQQVIVERLLSLSGEDLATVDRKNREAWTGRLGARVLILSNELPRLADASGALAGRFMIVPFEQSFFGREDPGLTDALLGELPGILNWALEGEARLRARGHFVQPASATELQAELEDLGSPVSAFLRDACEVGPGFEVDRDALFSAWRLWGTRQGREHAGTQATFGRDLRAAVAGLKDIRHKAKDGTRTRTYQGLRLQPAAPRVTPVGPGKNENGHAVTSQNN